MFLPWTSPRRHDQAVYWCFQMWQQILMLYLLLHLFLMIFSSFLFSLLYNLFTYISHSAFRSTPLHSDSLLLLIVLPSPVDLLLWSFMDIHKIIKLFYLICTLLAVFSPGCSIDVYCKFYLVFIVGDF